MIRIKVDGETLWAGEPGDWEEKPPESFREMVKPGARVHGYMKAIALEVAEAVVTKRDTRINVVTNPQGYTMRVVRP